MDEVVVKVASYNVHRCVGVDCRYDPQRIIDVMKELDCGVIGLQEVDNRAGRGHASLQLDHLADSMNMRPIAGMRIIKHLGEYGNALLTRYPVKAVRRHDLSHSRREPRGALDVDLDIDGLAVRVVVTHLGLGASEREHQARRLAEALQLSSAEQPLILLGDINEWLPRARSIRILQAIMGASPAGASFPSRAPMLALDRIWARPAEARRAFQVHRSSGARVASDHLPVKAELAFTMPPSSSGT